MCIYIWREERTEEARWGSGNNALTKKMQPLKVSFYVKTSESSMLETNANYLYFFVGQIILSELGGSLQPATSPC